jgi:hypothetical protein
MIPHVRNDSRAGLGLASGNNGHFQNLANRFSLHEYSFLPKALMEN